MSIMNKQNIAISMAVIAIIGNVVMGKLLIDSGAFEKSTTTEIRMVDVVKLTRAAQEKLKVELENKIRSSGVMIDGETVNALAQVEADRLFTHINEVAGEHDLVFSKSNIIKGPTGIDITEQIASDLGMDLSGQ